ncbi:THO complex subunit 1 transcription elongation factor-domain-containing protein [Lanmaoa asiatica]|nr:THO complex subunit 1 transcription elongation factor-domain-containing protein [Lanmaoa asiatica]
MTSQAECIQRLLASFPARPFDQKILDEKVAQEVHKFKDASSQENVRSRWELVLRKEVFALAATEGNALKEKSADYYDGLQDRLDLVLTFTEQDACEAAFPFTVLQDLLETQTIVSCSHIFSWIEIQASRLTQGMVPQKGKALILLRTLNDLLRRLSKTGSTTMFCGRILTFLSGVFPLGERSGVNLRGEYGPVWEGTVEVGRGDVEMKDESSKPPVRGDKMDVDGEPGYDEAKKQSKLDNDDFYKTFWSLQLPFSRPPIFASPGAFDDFKQVVEKVLPVIKEATTKERAMMGNRASASQSGPLKRKREAEPGEETNTSDYFFAKFLTSPDLLSLEIADTHFRRQVLFQLLILLNHLLLFTKSAKAAWATPRNRSLQMDFTLEPTDAQWVQDTIVKATAELRSTAPNGPAFADTVNVILEREKNWVKWKNDLCAPFDREPWSEEVEGKKVGLEEATKELRAKKREEPEEWKWNLGSQPLTEIWEMGYRDSSDLQNPFQAGDVKDFVKKIRQEDARIEMRKKTLAKSAERIAQARAKAAAAQAPPATEAPAPSQEISTTTAEPAKVEPSSVAPQPVQPVAESPLHPSLPPKPGTSVPARVLGTEGPSNTSAVAAPVSTPPAPAITTPALSSTPASAPPTDEQILKLEDNKQRWSWLALRTARDQHLQYFGKIGTGDVLLLAQEIEADKEREREREREREKAQKTDENVTNANCSHVVFALQQTRRYKTKRAAKIDTNQCDLTSPEQVRAVFDKYGKGGIWGVVHIAAYKAVGESVEIPLTYYTNNVSATISLLQIMSEYDCTRIVYSSSATVYGIPPTIPIPETTRLKADSPYGKTKVMSEMIIDDLCHAEPQRWRAISLRYFNPAGAHPSGLIGEDPRGRPGNLLPLLAQMAIGRVNESTLKVFGNDYPTPDGTCVRDYLHVLDLASGHLLALDALAPNSKVFDNCPDEACYKAYNLGKGRGMSVLQIVDAMRTATEFDYKYEVIGRRRGDVPDLTADPTLAEKELGFKAPQTLEVMCRDLWNWQTKNPQGEYQALKVSSGQSSSGWEIRMSSTHKVPYYFNVNTNASTWESPLPKDELRKLPGAHYLEPPQIRASHLLIKHNESRRPSSWKESTITRTKDEGITILRKHQAEIDAASNKSDTFGELAKVHSDCSSHDKSGDLGMFARGQMQKPFEEAAFGLKVGEISDIVSTESGVHIIMRTA